MTCADTAMMIVYLPPIMSSHRALIHFCTLEEILAMMQGYIPFQKSLLRAIPTNEPVRPNQPAADAERKLDCASMLLGNCVQLLTRAARGTKTECLPGTEAVPRNRGRALASFHAAARGSAFLHRLCAWPLGAIWTCAPTGCALRCHHTIKLKPLHCRCRA